MWAYDTPPIPAKTIVNSSNRIIYHDDGPDKRIYMSFDGSFQFGNNNGLIPIGWENPHLEYKKGDYVHFYKNGGHIVTNNSHHPNELAGTAISEDETIFEIVCFVYGGVECVYEIAKSGGKYLIRRVGAKKAAGVVDDMVEASLDDFVSLYRQQVGVVRAPKGGISIAGKDYKGGQIIKRIYIEMGRGGSGNYRALQELSSGMKPGITKEIPGSVGIGLAVLGYLYYHVTTLIKN
jgi:hypothetical protein